MLKQLQNKFTDFAGSFYNWGAGLAKKLARASRLTQLSERLSRRVSKPPLILGIESFVALTLVVYFFFLMLPQADTPRHYDGNVMNIYLFTYLSDHPYSHQDLIANFDNWKARLAGPMITGWMYDLSYKTFSQLYHWNLVDTDMFVFGGYFARVPVVVFGFYHALWLLLLYGLLIAYRQDALLLMLGIFGGLMYNFTMPAGQWFYPWDMPTMFFFTWACLLYDRDQIIPLMVVVWLGSLFKETTLCCALLILLGRGWSWKQRIGGFAATAAGCLLTRKLLMAGYGVHTMFFALNNSGNTGELAHKTWALLVQNIRLLFSPHLNHVLFTNAGALLIMMLIPWRNGRDVAFKILAVVFIIGQFLCGIIIEFRIWYELLPLGWMTISEALSRRYRMTPHHHSTAGFPPSAAEEPANPAWPGTYWLMLVMLLAGALGILFITR